MQLNCFIQSATGGKKINKIFFAEKIHKAIGSAINTGETPNEYDLAIIATVDY